MYTTTIVTCLYDIGRGNNEHVVFYRSYDTYKTWFKLMLSISCPMVVYVDKKDELFVKKNRPHHVPTKIVVRSLDDFDTFKRFFKPVETILQNTLKKKNLIECHNPFYVTLMHLKIELMKLVSESNPFQTDIFFWMDAGIYRDSLPFHVSTPWPDPLKLFLFSTDQLVMPTFHDFDPYSRPKNEYKYCIETGNIVYAYCFGGTRKAVLNVHDSYVQTVQDCINHGVTNNDQILHQLVAFRHPELYLFWSLSKKDPFVENQRTLPHELAYKTVFLFRPFPLCQELLTIGFISENIPYSNVRLWLSTGAQQGYQLHVIGRNEPWKNFRQKIQSVYFTLCSQDFPYVLITDTTDVFFTDCASRLLANFKEMDKSIVIGAEPELHYRHGKYPKNVIKHYFSSICPPSRLHKFPNGGMLIGKREKLIRLFQSIHDRFDDQAAYMDYMYETQDPGMTLDYETRLFGNIPNYRSSHPSYSYFQYDKKLLRYIHRDIEHTPSVFHFPGQEFREMFTFYDKTYLGSNESSNYTDYRFLLLISCGLIVLLIILVVVLSVFLARCFAHKT